MKKLLCKAWLVSQPDVATVFVHSKRVGGPSPLWLAHSRNKHHNGSIFTLQSCSHCSSWDRHGETAHVHRGMRLRIRASAVGPDRLLEIWRLPPQWPGPKLATMRVWNVALRLSFQASVPSSANTDIRGFTVCHEKAIISPIFWSR